MTSPIPSSPKPGASAAEAPIGHGGDLGAARALFPGAPEPIVDLSTGVNPHPYPIAAVASEDFARLPEPERLAGLVDRAAAFYGAPSAEHVVAAPGGQILMALIADLSPKGEAAILGPTYAEHARVTAFAGHDVETVSAVNRLGAAPLAIVVNPNNPDGRLLPRAALLAIAERQKAHGGLLVVDEAFMDAEPDESVGGDVESANIVVLRSFGKFFGLAGLRLSFALSGRELAARLRARLGPWPVSGPALAIWAAALSDRAWIEKTRKDLRASSGRLGALLRRSGLEIVGRTGLFCLARSPDAQRVFRRLGEAGVFVRRFDEDRHLLRFGLPGTEIEWKRLEDALRTPA